MIFKELDTKQKFSNRFGNLSYISNYCYYEGTEQISIYIKTGYGASERTINEVISEHDLAKWITEFKINEIKKEKIKPTENINLSWVKPTEIKPKIMNENTDKKSVDNFDSMREIIFESMRMVKAGTLDVEKAKSISMLGQTIINSVKVEVDFIKLTGSSNKSKMID
jgi:hypothetical protein